MKNEEQGVNFIVLASGSPRRQEYFQMLELPFIVVPSLIDESRIKHKNPKKLTRELAIKKVEKVIKTMENPPDWVCGADTVIAKNGKIFGKPQDRKEAAFMLKELSGEQHKVVTSVALYNGKKIDCRSSVCKVTFASLSKKEIKWYIDSNEWKDAAGAYRIQGLAACFITKINGCPSTVTGLPLNEFYDMLRSNGYPFGA
jgi:septum formation protein